MGLGLFFSFFAIEGNVASVNFFFYGNWLFTG